MSFPGACREDHVTVEAEQCAYPRIVLRPVLNTLVYESLQACVGLLVALGIVWLLVYRYAPAPWGWWVTLSLTGLAVAVFVGDLFLNLRQQRHYRIEFDAGRCTIYRGRFLTTRTVIVPGSVLSVDLVRGPLLRMLGLARVKLGGIAQFPEIVALAQKDAIRLQDAFTAVHNGE